ncbi:hypothetical protein B9Z55_007402 [Caenorhabditis nigoni]|uniref:Uncharacterized protein n=1 Tax=Caenorhabditis nigoni TaxID=1611254 RepID=A0A2G5V9V0_9PELO|nr:hypothetical protein B9Z55_007402 [Caenorhabditis nigoni]
MSSPKRLNWSGPPPSESSSDTWFPKPNIPSGRVAYKRYLKACDYISKRPIYQDSKIVNLAKLFDPNNVEWPQRVFRVADKNGSSRYEAYCKRKGEIGYRKAWKNATADSALKLEWRQRAVALKEEQDDQINRGYLVVLRRG